MRAADIGFVIAAVAIVVSSTVAHVTVAQTGRSVWSAVYSREQASRGRALYARHCASCHGPAMEGRDESPPLAGAGFGANWEGHSLSELFERIAVTMPGDDPGTLTPQQNADILAYLLAGGKFPAGRTDLPHDADELKTILITALKP
jgi:S-disulfanyl-L-cysteine oxidoreductase SoxD